MAREMFKSVFYSCPRMDLDLQDYGGSDFLNNTSCFMMTARYPGSMYHVLKSISTISIDIIGKYTFIIHFKCILITQTVAGRLKYTWVGMQSKCPEKPRRVFYFYDRGDSHPPGSGPCSNR